MRPRHCRRPQHNGRSNTSVRRGRTMEVERGEGYPLSSDVRRGCSSGTGGPNGRSGSEETNSRCTAIGECVPPHSASGWHRCVVARGQAASRFVSRTNRPRERLPAGSPGRLLFSLDHGRREMMKLKCAKLREPALLAVVSLLVISGWPTTENHSHSAVAAPRTGKASRARTAGGRRTKPPTFRLPPLKTPEQKLRLLELFRQSMPAFQIGRHVQFTSRDLDTSLKISIGKPSYLFARPVDDTTFCRRVYLDVIGRNPTPRELLAFERDTAPNKRAKLIDRLLETEEYARKWAHYWREVVFFNSAANKNRVNPQAFEDWLAEEFRKNTPWDRIVAKMISATPKSNGKLPNGKPDVGQNYGPNNFVLACENKPTQIASQTARIFMGISIQCAECHDHPFDRWKRIQFHQMAAFFARGKYYMPDQDDPAKKHLVKPKFLLGEEPPEVVANNPDARRVAVAAYLVYNPDNYWFARAFVNRVWNELLGDGFYAVDSLGPDAEVIHKLLVNRIAAVFRYRQFDIKWLFRLILNTETYQRGIRTIDSEDEYFTAVRPTRLQGPVVVANLNQFAKVPAPVAREIRSVFRFDPSIPQRDLEGSIQQALLMMNHPALQNSLRNSPLKKRLLQIADPKERVRQAYLAVLARHPTSAEQERGMRLFREAGNPAAGIDDLLWVLVNSTEFVTKR
ncbi:MAG: DUF1549 domain-containing protein [Planctomycetota bacterium]|nr:MAG: DUF1549 domain-containing protein [Planctomycetota bacterium]